MALKLQRAEERFIPQSTRAVSFKRLLGSARNLTLRYTKCTDNRGAIIRVLLGQLEAPPSKIDIQVELRILTFVVGLKKELDLDGPRLKMPWVPSQCDGGELGLLTHLLWALSCAVQLIDRT